MSATNTTPPETLEITKEARQVCVVDASLKDYVSPIVENGEMRDFQVLYRLPAPDDILKSLCVILVSDSELLDKFDDYSAWIKQRSPEDTKFVVLSLNQTTKNDRQNCIPPGFLYLTLADDTDLGLILSVLTRAFETLLLENQNSKLDARLQSSYEEIRKLTEVGQALATEHDFDRLLSLMLKQAKELVSADSGTIYVAERNSVGGRPMSLRFKKTSLSGDAEEYLLPIDNSSIAGYVAFSKKPLVINDVYSLTGEEDYHFNQSFDLAHDYTTKSVMTIPMVDSRDEIIGVVQLINRREDDPQNLTLGDLKSDGVFPFTRKCLELATALVGQAAVVIQNNQLLEDINNLFEGFVKASVTAIEQRDPITAGHSFRVAEYTIRLAKAVSESNRRPFENVSFNDDEIRELRYASLLHDFGKVGVSEHILTKAKKLYPSQLDLIEWRFRYLRKTIENDILGAKLGYLKENGKRGYLDFEGVLNTELKRKVAELDEMFRIIEVSNDPISNSGENFDTLKEISLRKIYTDTYAELPLLHENELLSLSVLKGNLNSDERREIETHVTQTHQFLRQIAWTAGLTGVPNIAHHHHEKLDGSGYPLGLKADAISIQTRMMTITDIYDALTAADRPYKKAASLEEAINILRLEEKDGHLDGDLLDLFIEKKIYEN